MLTKTYTARLKAVKDADGADTGEIEMYVSAFGNVDKVGDRVHPDAFEATLKAWRESGDPIPMVWSHDWANPFAHVGVWDAEKSEADSEGLLLRGKMDIEDNEFARQAYMLVKSRRVREASFGYEVIEERTAKDGANDLLVLDLIEAGPTLKGANPATRLVSAKSDAACPACGQALKSGPDDRDADEDDHAEDEAPTTEPEPVRHEGPADQELRDRVLRLALGL